MALFLKGRYKGFYAAGHSKCVRDVFKFRKSSETHLFLEHTRRDLTSYARRFWLAEYSTFKLFPVDESQPRLGGKVEVTAFSLDVRTLRFRMKKLYGVYNDEFLSVGEFMTEQGESPLGNESALLEVTKDVSGSKVLRNKRTFRFENDTLSFEEQVNEALADTEIEHAIEKTELQHHYPNTWSETFFYGLGNSRS